MKKLYWVYLLIAIVVVAGGLWWLAGDNAPTLITPKPERLVGDEAKLAEAISSAEVRIPELNIAAKLEEGEADFASGGLTAGSIRLVSVLGQQPLADGSYDVFANLSVNTGGTGTFNYVGLFHVSAEGVNNTSAVFVGDRVVIEGVVFGDDLPEGGYRLSINYLGRDLGDAMVSEPTIADSLELRVTDHEITGLKY
ncbi:MAG: hypothetical protein A2114_00960 [Candidatus Vogelbacteria bacterium GWA1_51_14]|uniref:Uncharacterized protein n=1 Tax=Candidatus Vogelbacteria bacterium GWA1_51_14 TaxID=1802435 RepID=A0A1G2QCS5_9BACT|nr:MAG: hypothetical protein A2114_00960 [Candidatus Vogelbacteria bacterium GWA1_51_14]